MNSAYEHGGACFPQGGVQAAGITDFSVNINPLGMPPAVREALHRLHSLSGSLCERTPRGACQALCGQRDTGLLRKRRGGCD